MATPEDFRITPAEEQKEAEASTSPLTQPPQKHEVEEEFEKVEKSGLEVLEEIDKLDVSKLPPELQTLDWNRLKECYKRAESISILITGKTGSGKSTITNGILGVKVKSLATEGDGTKPCTKTVEEYKTKKGKIKITVWDSPGLQDGKKEEDQEKCLEQIKSKCQNRDLTIYCVRVSDIRFVDGDDNPDVVAMKKLTSTFGIEFWENTIIVLTFANILEALNVDWEKLSYEDKAEKFQAKIQEWEAAIKECLIQNVEVPEKQVDLLRVIPAGHYKKPHLPGCRFWLSVLWFQCICVIPNPERQVALVAINADRLKPENKVKTTDFDKPPEEQPIVLEKMKKIPREAKEGVAVGAIAGASVGGLIGLVGVIGGPVGLAIGVGFGVGAGATIGVALAGLIVQVKYGM